MLLKVLRLVYLPHLTEADLAHPMEAMTAKHDKEGKQIRYYAMNDENCR